MNSYLSDKLRNLSFVAMIMIVFIHAHNVPASGVSLNSINFWIQKLAARGICDIAVPFFFIVSGYLFVQGYNNKWSWFVIKYKKRIRTLLVPYLVFAAVGGLLAFPLVIMANVHAGRELLMNTILADSPGFITALDRFIGFTVAPKMNLHLWFLRVLIMIVVLSPLFVSLSKHLRNLGLWLMICFFVALPETGGFWMGVNCFLAGSCMAFYPIKSKLFASKSFISASFILSIILFILTIYLSCGSNFSNLCVSFVRRCAIISGLLAFYFGYDLLNIKNIFKFAGFSFWIYCVHMPMEAYITVFLKESLTTFCSDSNLVLFSAFLITPFLTISFCIGLGKLLERHMNGFYKFVSGGR